MSSRPMLAAALCAAIVSTGMLLGCARFAEQSAARPNVADPWHQEEQHIRAALSAYAAARQRGDGAAQAAYYTVDAEFWHPRSGDPLYRGRGRMQNLLAGEPAPFRLEPVNISFAAPDVALVDAHFFGTDATPDGVAYYVMAKRSGDWLIRAVRIIPLPLPNSS